MYRTWRRKKKKRFRNEMDDMEKGYGNDMYGSSDFDQIKNKIYCSVCHGEDHTMNRHKEGPKRNPRACGAAGRNRRSGATDIIEVTHTSMFH
jgi:ribonuclease PH